MSSMPAQVSEVDVRPCPKCGDAQHQILNSVHKQSTEGKVEIWHCRNPACKTATGSSGEGGSHSYFIPNK